jgi:hypothetical protein
MAQDRYGALVGWATRGVGQRMILEVQTIEAGENEDGQATSAHHLLMTRNQALLLANHLFKLAGEQPPEPRPRGTFSRLFG